MFHLKWIIVVFAAVGQYWNLPHQHQSMCGCRILGAIYTYALYLWPGPGAYMLPPTLGYTKHDYTRYRNPQYSMGIRTRGVGKPFGPGPQYNVQRMNQHGRDSPPAYSCSARNKPLTAFKTPGPGTYSPEKAPRMKEPRPPAYSIANRLAGLKPFNTPGPNQYQVPTTVGCKVPHKIAAPCFSMAKTLPLSGKEKSPGPAKYGGIPTNLYLSKPPQYTIGNRLSFRAKGVTPGPAAYMVKVRGPCNPGYTMGIVCNKKPYITPDDVMPCINK